MEPVLSDTPDSAQQVARGDASYVGAPQLPTLGIYMKYIIISILFFSSPILAEKCNELKGSEDGVPALYYQEKCMADKEFENGNYAAAANHYKKASAVKFFEAPNYWLRVELAKSLCLSGEKSKGLKIAQSFMLMAKADLGEVECPDDTEQIIGSEYLELACIGYGSSLSEQGRSDLKKRIKTAEEVVVLCKDT